MYYMSMRPYHYLSCVSTICLLYEFTYIYIYVCMYTQKRIFSLVEGLPSLLLKLDENGAFAVHFPINDGDFP